MRSLLSILAPLYLTLCLSACGGGSGGDSPGAPSSIVSSISSSSSSLSSVSSISQSSSSQSSSDAFAEVRALLQTEYESERLNGLTGMTLIIFNDQDEKIFEQNFGNFNADQTVAIASASKWVSGTVLLSLVGKNEISFDDTTGDILGWTKNSNVNFKQLLSFTSGMDNEHICIYTALFTFEECVALISTTEPLGLPGTRYDYGGTHLQVAGRMAEVVTEKSWKTILNEELLIPLGLDLSINYYAQPLGANGSQNPMIAGGMRISMNQYAKILQMIYHKGLWKNGDQQVQLIPADLFDEQAKMPYPNVIIGNVPPSAPESIRYGLSAWLECANPAEGCQKMSSPGAFGFTPWIDREHGYYAILGMEYESAQGFGFRTEQKLQPVIEQALE
jgi:serine-type D-Ala-D-Ala carboxypeptidase/endopeptidase